MKLYGGIDLHSNNSVIALLDEEDRPVYRRRLGNERWPRFFGQDLPGLKWVSAV
jgi:hypothetical protein